MPTKKICPACGVQWSMEAIKYNECNSCGYPQNIDDFDTDNEPEIIRCSNCDGHPACEDFGCAYDLLDSDDNDLFDEFGNNALL